MKAEEVRKKIGSNIKLILKNGFHYTGTIINVVGDDLVIKDRYDAEVYINLSEISVFEDIYNGR